MNRFCVSFGLVWMLISVGFGFDGLGDPLWQRALEIARTNSDWVPGLTVMRSELLHAGATNGFQEVWKRAKLGDRGDVITTIVKVIDDGADVTEKEKSKFNRKPENREAKFSTNPFDFNCQERLLVRPTRRSRTIEGNDCAGYEFEMRNTNGPTAKGRAWLEKASGFPVEIEGMTLEPLPDKHIKRMMMTTRYERSLGGIWRIKEVRTVATVKKMFITAEIQTVTTFSEYWRKPEAR